MLFISIIFDIFSFTTQFNATPPAKHKFRLLVSFEIDFTKTDTDFYNPNASTVICQFDTSNWMNYNLQRYERVFTFGNLNNEDEAPRNSEEV